MDHKLGIFFMIHRISSVYDELVLLSIILFDSTSVGRTPN